MRQSIVLILIVVLSGIGFVHAQGNVETGWPVEQRCVEPATAPPDDWTYDGTILMTGRWGIHAIQRDWATPRVMVFLNREFNLPGAALSPDGNWYATPTGVVRVTESNNVITAVEGIGLYHTTGNDEELLFEWPRLLFFQGEYAQIYWPDNDHLVYEGDGPIGAQQLNRLTGDISAWERVYLSGIGLAVNSTPSPDWSRIIHEVDIRDGITGEVISPLAVKHERDHFPAVAWRTDSAGFAAEIQNDSDSDTHSIEWNDHNGQSIETILQLPEMEHLLTTPDFDVSNMIWSPDGRYLAFTTTGRFSYPYFPRMTHLMIADTQERRVFDTCMAAGQGLTWSHDSSQLAFLEAGDRQRAINILEMESQQVFTIGFHFMVTFGPRDMINRGTGSSIIGWREN